MALTWDVSKIEDHDSVCFREATVDQPMRGVSKGDRIMNPVTDALIWATMAVGIGQLTEESAPEFYARLSLIEDMDGPWMSKVDEDGNFKKVKLAQPDDIRAHIGLSTNATFEVEPRSKWLRRITRELDARAQRYKDAVASREDEEAAA